MNHKISVIVPVYNVKEYVGECIESILAQTYRNLEVILVDDGSTDGSGSICEDYARMDERIVVVHKENGGLSDARNAGMDVATGEFIGFVDSDDYIEPDMYETLLKSSLEAGDHSISCIRYDEVGEGCAELPPADGNVRVLSVERFFYDILSRHHTEYVTYSVWCRLYRVNDISGNRFAKGKIFEDILFTTKVLPNVNTCVHINKTCYHYRIREGSITHGEERKAMDERMITHYLEQENEAIHHLRKIGAKTMEMMNRAFVFSALLYIKAKNPYPMHEALLDGFVKDWRISPIDALRLPQALLRERVKIAFKMACPRLMCAIYGKRE